jgi:DNA-binding response OmpR family regulator
MSGEQILLVEDDERIGASLVRALTGTGYSVSWERAGADALRSAAGTRVDLVLLDLGLPDVDGLDVCRELQAAAPEVPIVMLTARDEEMDVVVGLDAGAADYVTKPFKLAELLARVRAALRQAPRRPVGPSNETSLNPSAGTVGQSAAASMVAGGDVAGTDVISAGDVTVDTASRRVWLRDVELDLRPKEFDVLTRLVRDAGRVVRRETLMSDVWDEHWFGSTKTLDFHIASLRRKIDADAATSHITTLRGVGYRFEVP